MKKIMNFSPWYVTASNEIIVSEPSSWYSLLDLHNEMPLTASFEVRVFGDVCSLQNPKKFLTPSMKRIACYCKCPIGIKDTTLIKCNTCSTYPQAFAHMGPLRRKFLNLVQSTPLIDWYVFTENLDDIVNTIYSPVVRASRCSECSAIIDESHLGTCSMSSIRNLFIVVVIPDKSVANLNKYEEFVIRYKRFNVLFLTKNDLRKMEVNR